MAFQLFHLFCRLAGNLAGERQSFYEAVGACNEHTGMPRGALLTPLSIGAYAPDRRVAVDENISLCQYFLLVIENIWEVTAADFLHDYRLAMKCRAASEQPMREVVVAIKKTPAGEEPADLAQFHTILERDGPQCFEFAGVPEFRSHLDRLLVEWVGGRQAAGSSGSL